MTPGARVAAAIEVLDTIFDGTAAEQALTRWARASRFAGSKDRAAIRDLVFDGLRQKRSAAWVGGAENGRGVMLGVLRLAGLDVNALFTGEGHAPVPVGDEELGQSLADAPEEVRLDMPDWAFAELKASHQDHAEIAEALRRRAPTFLRVNLSKGSRDEAIAVLAEDSVLAHPHRTVRTALEVVQNPRRVKNSKAYLSGLVELQDASSQAVIEAVPKADRALDYCAGGGGKTLALSALGAKVFAHDANPKRMAHLPERAGRAGAQVKMLNTDKLDEHAPFDLVLCDVPCSGSGSWRRDPQGKWRVSQKDLADIEKTQAEILVDASVLVGPRGSLAYVTCSVLQCENLNQIELFLNARPNWKLDLERQYLPNEAGDGFYLAVMSQH